MCDQCARWRSTVTFVCFQLFFNASRKYQKHVLSLASFPFEVIRARIISKQCQAKFESFHSFLEAAVTADVSAFVRLCGLNLVVDQLTAVVEEAVAYTGHVLGAAWHQRRALYCTSRLMTHGHFYALRHRDGRVTDADQRIADRGQGGSGCVCRAFWPRNHAVHRPFVVLRVAVQAYGRPRRCVPCCLRRSVARVFQPDVETLGRKENELSSMYVYSLLFVLFVRAHVRLFVPACLPLLLML